MCKGEPRCTELPDRATMHPLAPLPLPWQFTVAFGAIHDGIRRVADGDISEAKALLARFPDKEARDWGIKHGQVSGRYRWRLLGEPPCPPAAGPRFGPRTVSVVLAHKVYERDGYQCRYCGLPVIPREVLRATTLVVGSTVFGTGKPNNDNHGGALLSWAQVDHVVPWNLGGVTDLSNLVTSCWACNYGKHNYALEQIAVMDPRTRMPVARRDGSWYRWDGLMSLLPALDRHARKHRST
jgi:HNH endonuclease